MIRRSGVLLVWLFLLVAGCGSLSGAFDKTIGERMGLTRSFWRALAEFDSSAARVQPEKEPEKLDYVEAPERLPWYVRQMEGLGFDFLLTRLLNVKPTPVAQENPSGYARERLVTLIDMVGDDLERGAQVAVRLLWVLEKDRNILNRVVSLRGVETIVHGLGLDPMDPLLDTTDDSAARRREVEAAETEMEQYWPGVREPGELGDDARQAFIAALDRELRSPLPTPRARRQLVLALARGYADETDGAMRTRLEAVLRRALSFATGLGLRNSLTANRPEVRDVAIRAYRRLCGPIGVPYVLRRIAAPAGSKRGNPYDPDPTVRLTLVRLCSQLRGEPAMKSVHGGKMPVDFLYETAIADDEAGLRQVALEGLALCLQRPKISFDEEWATTWRQQFIVERSER
ncbi:MAG: hypothetical protein ACYTGW_01625 [Planctomycetota bacterium]|jgi:hypothetical protein